MPVLFIFFLAVVFIQLVYFTVFIFALLRKDDQVTINPLQPVSVIVCAHDEEENLRELIPMLLAQDHPQFEVIIVNDRSNDGTYDLLLQETKKDTRLRMVNVDYLPDHVDGKKYGITLAIKAAQYPIVLLTDADCRPAADSWVSSMGKSFNPETKFVLGYSPYIRENGFLNLFIRFETLFTAMQYMTFALLGNPYMGVGRNLAYRKSIFLDTKGFNGILRITGGDDDLFVNKHADQKNVKVCLGRNTVVYSNPQKTWKDFFHQKVRHLAVGKKYKLKHRILLGIFSLSFLTGWISGAVLLFIGVGPLWVISALALKTTFLMIAVYRASKRFGHKFEVWSVPLLDFLFVIYYISTGTVALVTNKVRWKKN